MAKQPEDRKHWSPEETRWLRQRIALSPRPRDKELSRQMALLGWNRGEGAVKGKRQELEKTPAPIEPEPVLAPTPAAHPVPKREAHLREHWRLIDQVLARVFTGASA